MISSFAELGLSEDSLKAITELGYEEPTPIQAQTIAHLLEGRDVIAQAQTGTGKTAAFALPIIERLDPTIRTPQALVLTPTRELAVQVAEAFQSYSKYHQLSVLPIYGGQPIERQLRALQRGVQIVVGTPGRLLDHLERQTLRLEGVQTVVLDEADEMLNMGFIEDIESILSNTPSERQTALFSATMPGPVAALARRYMREPQRITVTPEQKTVDQIRQVYYEIGKRDKFDVLTRVLDYEIPTSAIIFCRTKVEVDAIGQRLTARAYPAETLHGDLNQVQRDRVMARFRSGQVELLIATDVAARGLDVEHVSHVINFDLPLDPEVYVHRIGRTGRAGRSGCAISLVTPRERNLWQVIQRSLGKASVQRQHLPTISDVVSRRRERFKETLSETLSGEGLEPYLVMAEEWSDEFSPTELAAAAFKLLLGNVPDVSDDPLAIPDEPESPDRKFVKKRSRSVNEGFAPERGMTRLYIDVGREEGVRPGDVVGAIANEADIPGRAIGAIEIYDHFTLVDVPSNAAQHVLKSLTSSRIRNHKVTVTLARFSKEQPQRRPRREDK